MSSSLKVANLVKMTGRTTALVNEAIELAEQGKSVYLVVASFGEIRRIRRMYPQVNRYARIHLETPEGIKLDWGHYDSARNAP